VNTEVPKESAFAQSGDVTEAGPNSAASARRYSTLTFVQAHWWVHCGEKFSRSFLRFLVAMCFRSRAAYPVMLGAAICLGAAEGSVATVVERRLLIGC